MKDASGKWICFAADEMSIANSWESPINMFTDRGPGMEIPGRRLITQWPWDQLGGGQELEEGGQELGGEEHGDGQQLEFSNVPDQDQDQGQGGKYRQSD